MQRKAIVLVILAFGLMTILAACKLPWEPVLDDPEPEETEVEVVATTRPTTETNAPLPQAGSL